MGEYPPYPKKNKFHALALLEVGVFELVFVTVVLFLIFGTLNYFNIFPVSSTFPEYLSWLPRKAPNGASPRQNKLSFTPAKPTITPEFQYDTKKAEAILTQYIKDTIKPDFLPAKLDIKQSYQIDGKPGPEHGFNFYYKTNNLLISSTFHYLERSNAQDGFSIFIQPPNIQETTASASLANSLTSLYFNNPYSLISNCAAKGTSSYCENFKIESNGKKGYGIVFGYDNGKFTSLVFNCFLPKESKFYSQNSCISP